MALARILIADQNAATRQMLVDILQENCEIVATVSDAGSVARLVGAVAPDVILLGLAFGETTGFQVARQLRQSNSNEKIIVVSIHESPDLARAALSVGASGYVFMSRVLDDLPAAIDAVREGKIFDPALKHYQVE